MNNPSKANSHKFSKSERLCSKRLTDYLFLKGENFKSEPLTVVYALNPSPSRYHQILITVPYKKFKKAVDRNLIKRRIREAYRLNKHLLNAKVEKLMIAYIYNSKEVEDYRQIESGIKNSIERLLTITIHK